MNTQRACREPAESTQRALKEHSKSTQRAIREQSERALQPPFKPLCIVIFSLILNFPVTQAKTLVSEQAKVGARSVWGQNGKINLRET